MQNTTRREGGVEEVSKLEYCRNGLFSLFENHIHSVELVVGQFSCVTPAEIKCWTLAFYWKLRWAKPYISWILVRRGKLWRIYTCIWFTYFQLVCTYPALLHLIVHEQFGKTLALQQLESWILESSLETQFVQEYMWLSKLGYKMFINFD